MVDPLQLLETLPDQRTQADRAFENQIRRTGLATQYTDEQRAAMAQAVQQNTQRAGAARNRALIQARETEFNNAAGNLQRMDPHPNPLRYAVRQDPAGGRKKRRRRTAARRQAPSNPPPASRFPTGPAHRNQDEMAAENMTGVQNWHVVNGPDGTFTAYEPKKQEWDKYCARIYGRTALLNANVERLTQLPPQIKPAMRIA